METLEEGKLKSPYSGFETFWYIIPGMTFLLGIFLFEYWCHSPMDWHGYHTPLYNALFSTASERFNQNWVLSAIYVLLLISIAYVIGHILSSIGAFVIERILVAKGYAYPYENLLKIKKDSSQIVKKHTASFYRGLFFWTNLYLLTRYTATFYPNNWWGYICGYVYIISEWIIISLIIVKILFEFCKYKLPKIFPSILVNKNKWYLKYPHDIINFILINIIPALYNLLSSFFSNFLNTRNSFDDNFIKLYKNEFKRIFGLNADECGKHNYWLSRFFIIEKSINLSRELFIWNSMYRFSRNLSVAFFMIFLYCFISLNLQINLINVNKDWIFLLLPLIAFLLTIIMLLQYFYFYANRYSRYVFRCFVFLNVVK